MAHRFFIACKHALQKYVRRPNTRADATTLMEAGYTLLKNGNPQDAQDYFHRALVLDPQLLLAKSHLGQALRLCGNLKGAEKILRDVINHAPSDALTYNRFATTLRELGNDREAELYYQKGLTLDPQNADILNNLGSLFNEYGQLQQATDYFTRAIASNPQHVTAKCNLCVNLSDRGLYADADRCFEEVIALDPLYYYARISHVMNKLPAVHADAHSIHASRNAYEKALIALRDWVYQQDTTLLAAASETVGWISPFYLTYQGQNDRDLQSIYGSLLCYIMQTRYPGYAQPVTMPTASGPSPLRIGIVSAYFYDHSNWKTPIRGWVENVDRSRFSLYGYCAGREHDSTTQQARNSFTHFYENIPFEKMAAQIRADNLHALIFPEIGMDPTTTKLAALRLAPVQYNSWGHPDTSGMPSIDYYLSSDLMEPEDAQAYYTEKLIRLPNLSIYYTPPTYKTLRLQRDAFGLSSDKILFCCAQSLFKYLPQFDFIFTSIAKKIASAQFVFFGHHKSDEIKAQFASRLHRAFTEAGLDPTQHIVMLPRLDHTHFQTAMSLCDVYLDSIEWSGCNTTLEAFLCNIPVITYRGSTLRGRHTTAFLTMMGLTDLIADTFERYIDLAVAMGNDATKRSDAAQRIRRQFPSICHDTACVRALEETLIEHIYARANT